MEYKPKTIGVLTSGGDAPGMNAALRAVTRAAISNDIKVKAIYRGYKGLIDGEVKEFTTQDVSGIIQRGGTIINARGVAREQEAAFFGITIQPEKEIVMILVESKIKNDILHALYRAVGLKTPGQGIAFAMPVSKVVGLSDSSPADKKSE